MTFPFFKSKLNFFKYRYLKLFKHYKSIFYVSLLLSCLYFIFYIYLSLQIVQYSCIHLFYFGRNGLIRTVKSFANYCTTDNNTIHCKQWQQNITMTSLKYYPKCIYCIFQLKNYVRGKVRSICKTIFNEISFSSFSVKFSTRVIVLGNVLFSISNQ